MGEEDGRKEDGRKEDGRGGWERRMGEEDGRGGWERKMGEESCDSFGAISVTAHGKNEDFGHFPAEL